MPVGESITGERYGDAAVGFALFEATDFEAKTIHPRVMEVRADPRTGGQLASPKLGARHPIDATVPRTEIG